MEEFIKNKLKIEYLLILIILITSICFLFYYKSNLRIKKVQIKDAVFISREETSKVASVKDMFVDGNIFNINVTLNNSELEQEESYNYIIGKEIGEKINFDLLLRKDDITYKIKTVYLGKDASGIILHGYIKNKKIKDLSGYEILINNKQSDKVYETGKVIGEDNNNG